MDYKNKLILAPMVRVGTLAFRLLALEYGADLVYSEEIIDYKMTYAKRTVNEMFNTIEYWVDGTSKPIFSTNEKERDRVIFQIGTNNPERALSVCKLIENDVAGIDVNMGCPKEFSVKGGMGCALLAKPDLIVDILTTLVKGLPNKPITCKIRCLKSLEETIQLCKRIEATGVKAIAVHGRFQDTRSSQPPHPEYIRAVANELSIPVIANGGSNTISTYEDIEKFRIECNASSVMLARCAMWNCSIFRKEGAIPLDDVMKRFLEISLETNNNFFSVKYAMQQMLHNELESERGKAVLASLNPHEIYGLFDMMEQYKEHVKKQEELIDRGITIAKRKSDSSDAFQNDEDSVVKKIKPDDILKTDEILDESVDGKKVITMHAKYVRTRFASRDTPKSILHGYSIQHRLPRPIYTTVEKKPERVYKSSLEFNNVIYSTPYWELNKQNTEQACAIVCLEILKVDYGGYKEEADKVI